MLNNIKSKFILQIVFDNVKILRKLKIIKNNTKLSHKLYIAPEDIENSKLLIDFNKKYSLNIEDIYITQIDFPKTIGIEALKDLCNIEFRKLKILCLSFNDVSVSDIDIIELRRAKFKNLLEQLILVGNFTGNIHNNFIFNQVYFKRLKNVQLVRKHNSGA